MPTVHELAFSPRNVDDLPLAHEVSVDTRSGAAIIRVPLPLTQGRGGFGPELALNYRSTAGNSPFGLGWSLSGAPGIAIGGKTLPRYDGRDRFVFDAGDVVPTLVFSNGAWRPRIDDRGAFLVRYYRNIVETSFVRIEQWVEKATQRIHWRTRDRNDVVTVYGLRANAASRIADPDDESRTSIWLAEARFDPLGNATLFDYAVETRDGVDAASPSERPRLRADDRFPQRYLKRIRYGNTEPMRVDAAEPQGNRWLFEVVLDYGDHADPDAPSVDPDRAWPARVDPHSNFRPGFEVRTHRLCRRILQFHRFPELGDGATLVGAIALDHAPDPAGTTLRSIRYTGSRRDGERVSRRSVPPLVFGYSVPSVGRSFVPAPGEATENVPHGLTGPGYQWIDLLGEGLPGILTETDQAWYYKPNHGGGRFGAQRLVAERPSRLAGTHAVGDFDRDGNTDVVVLQGRDAGVYELDRNTDRWRSFRPFPSLPHLEGAGSRVQWLDLNGDGLPDLVLARSDRFIWYPSRGKDGFGEAIEIPKPQVGLDPAGVTEDPELDFFFADMTGDGMLDLVRVRNGRVEYWPQLGNGRFGPAILMEGSPDFARDDELDAGRLRLVDLDGSGTTDLVYLGRGDVRTWINAAGNRLVEGPRVGALPYVDNRSTARVLDFLGDGTPCLVWSSPLPGRATPIEYLPLTSGVKPRLLLSVENSVGQRVTLEYSSSATHYLRDQRSGRGWRSRLPSHVNVVDRLEVVDLIGGSRSVSRYEYHDGVYDGGDQSFRCFGLVDQYDAELHGGANGDPALQFTTPACTRTWFHDGGDDRRRVDLDRYALDAAHALLPLHEIADPGSLENEEYQDALDALAGQPIRQELFAVDASGNLAPHPFQVMQDLWRVERVQPRRDELEAVFSLHRVQHSISDHEQQPDDPRVQQSVLLAIDRYGNVEIEADLAYPRRQGRPVESPAQQALAAQASRNRFVNVDTPDRYELGIDYESQGFELAGLAPAGDSPIPIATLRVDVPAALAGAALIHDPFPAGGGVDARLVEWDQSYYWNDAMTAALPLGDPGSRALPHHDESACFTTPLVADVFANRIAPDAIGAEGGYVERDGHWWEGKPVQRYHGADGFFQLQRIERTDGGTTTWTLDAHHFAVVAITDDRGSSRRAEIDYNLPAPWRITDPNGNVTEVRHDPLGVIVVNASRGALLGENGAGVPYGYDLLDAWVDRPNPTFAGVLADPAGFLQNAREYIYYDLDTWTNLRQPTRIVTLLHEELIHDGRGGGAAGRIQVNAAHLDGFGRELQNKLLVEPGDAIQRDQGGRVRLDHLGVPVLAPAQERWVVSGHTVFNRKQQPVQKYEPFFTTTPEFEPDEELARFGVTESWRYDALGRIAEEQHANGSFSRTEHLPWAVRRHDANDTVLESIYRAVRTGRAANDPEKRALTRAEAHAGTPLTLHVDPEGRVVKQVEQGAGNDRRVTETRYDSRGNIVELIDARGIGAWTHRLDMRGRALYTRSVDAGETRVFPDAFDRPVHVWDGRGVHQTRTFDTHDRTLTVSVEGAGLVEQMIYGEDAQVDHAELRNARGRLFLVRDQAGERTVEQYDPTGLELRSLRRLRVEYKREADWTDPAGEPLENDRWTTEVVVDGLARVRSEALPDGTTRRTEYLRGGGAARVSISTSDGRVQDLEILGRSVFNARGQRTYTRLGNGVDLSVRYDDQTFHTKRITAVRGQTALQDLEYTYDPVGNVTRAIDHAQEPSGAGAVIRGLGVTSESEYTYDPYYQLVEATGRVHQALLQHDYRPGIPGAVNGTRHLSLNNGQAVERYTRTYRHDAAGNIRELRHAGVTSQWTTEMWISPTSNRSVPTRDPQGNPVPDPAQSFDEAGQTIRLAHLRRLDWSWKNTLSRAVVIDRSAQGLPDDAEYYTYDAGGERVRKVSERVVAGDVVITEKIYFDGAEIKRVRSGGDLLLERRTSHVGEGAERVAMVHRWLRDAQARETDDTQGYKVRYQLFTHIGSSVLELDEEGRVIGYEEYFPYGGTAFLAGDGQREVDLKEYRFTGKERDEATGLYYFRHRYYAPWTGRWLSPDPIGPEDSLNLYEYVGNNPINLIDPDGQQGRRPQGGQYIPVDPRTLSTTIVRDVAAAYQKLRPEERRGTLYFYVDPRTGIVTIGSRARVRAAAESDRRKGNDVFWVQRAREDNGKKKGPGGGGGKKKAKKAPKVQTISFTEEEAGTVERPAGKPAVTAGPEQGDTGEATARNAQGEKGDSKGKSNGADTNSDGTHNADGSSTTTTPATKTGDGGKNGTGLGLTGGRTGGGGDDKAKGEAEKGAGGGKGKEGAGKGAADAMGDDEAGQGGTGEELQNDEDEREETQGKGKETERQLQNQQGGENPNNLPPSDGKIPIPADKRVNGDDINGSPDGGLTGTRGTTGKGTNTNAANRPANGNAAAGDRREKGESPTGQKLTTTDKLVRYAGYANFEFKRSDRGQSGGIPGGRGKYNLGRLGQWLYIALSVISVISLAGLVKSLFTKALQIGLRASLRSVGRFLVSPFRWIGRGFARFFGRSGNRVGLGRRFLRFIWEDRRTFNASREFFNRWRRIFGANTGASRWSMEHMIIKQRWYRGATQNLWFPRGSFGNRVLQGFGDAGWNVVPVPHVFNEFLKRTWASWAFNGTVYGGGGYGLYRLYKTAWQRIRDAYDGRDTATPQQQGAR